jgi:hypothetical protein
MDILPVFTSLEGGWNNFDEEIKLFLYFFAIFLYLPFKFKNGRISGRSVPRAAADGSAARPPEVGRAGGEPGGHWAVFRIRIHRIHMFLGHKDPDPLVRCMDPDPFIIKQK